MSTDEFLEIGVYIALVLFGIGVIYKMSTWFSGYVGVINKRVSTPERAAKALLGIVKAIFSVKLLSILKVIIVDVIFQGRILKDKQDRMVAVMHVLIFLGFMGLLIFHALGTLFSEDIIGTVNPWMALRNIFGVMSIAGLVLAIVRRIKRKNEIKTSGMDVYALVLLIVIMVTGFLLEGLKITSYSVYQRMVDEYGDAEDEPLALESYWVAHYGLVSPNVQEPVSDDVLAVGEEKNNDYCVDCHIRPNAAFVSYAIAKAIKPAALPLDKSGIQTVIWYIHVIACLFGLAFLAFTKMFHIFSTPASLFVAETTDCEESADCIATRQAIELDGCSHGGTCRLDCPVRIKRQERIDKMEPFAPVFDYVGTKNGTSLGNREIAR
jgi:nitrate reductase gamma subunit